MTKVLILFYSKHGATQALAEQIAIGVEAIGCEALIRCVPAVSNNLDESVQAIPESGDRFAIEYSASCGRIIKCADAIPRAV